MEHTSKSKSTGDGVGHGPQASRDGVEHNLKEIQARLSLVNDQVLRPEYHASCLIQSYRALILPRMIKMFTLFPFFSFSVLDGR